MRIRPYDLWVRDNRYFWTGTKQDARDNGILSTTSVGACFYGVSDVSFRIQSIAGPWHEYYLYFTRVTTTERYQLYPRELFYYMISA